MKFDAWYARFQQQYQEYLDELMEVGTETARATFIMADSIGNVDVSVSNEKNPGRGFTITASGEDVNFLEFGAGVLTEVQRPTVQASFDISPGSWSSSEDGTGEFERYGSWHWNHVRFFGLAPAAGMQEACNQMEQRSSEIAGRVFG